MSMGSIFLSNHPPLVESCVQIPQGIFNRRSPLTHDVFPIPVVQHYPNSTNCSFSRFSVRSRHSLFLRIFILDASLRGWHRNRERSR